jgi:DNA-binding protein H-NS
MTLAPETVVIWIALNVATIIFCWMIIEHRREKAVDVESTGSRVAMSFGRRQGDSRPIAGPQRDKKSRRPYPKVLPKFRNPGNPTETWCGRGKTPRWLSAQLASGRSIEEFRIASAPHNLAGQQQMLAH